MKLSRAFALAALSKEGASQSVVSTSFQRVQFPPDLVQITRRDTLNLAAINNITGGGYYSEVQVGTPGQKTLMHLDTGSSDTWVVDKQADLCTSRSLQRKYGTGCTGTFDSGASSTYKLVTSNGFDITYLDGRNIRGDYIQDSVSFDGKTTTKQQLGLAIETVKGTGLMGLGFSEGVATRRRYPTILDNMVSQGHIGRKAFSIWLVRNLASSLAPNPLTVCHRMTCLRRKEPCCSEALTRKSTSGLLPRSLLSTTITRDSSAATAWLSPDFQSNPPTERRCKWPPRPLTPRLFLIPALL